MEGDLDRLGEERTERDAMAGSGVEQTQLAVRPEPAVRPVDVVEKVDDGGARRLDVAVLDQEVDVRPQSAPAGSRQDGYDPPLETWPEPEPERIVGVVCWVVVDDEPLVVPDASVDVESLDEPDVVPEVAPDVLSPALEPDASVSWWPEYVIAASPPRPTTEADPATAIPRVSDRTRSAARVRSAGLSRDARSMAVNLRPTTFRVGYAVEVAPSSPAAADVPCPGGAMRAGRNPRSRRAFETTVTDEAAIAAEATIGSSNQPVNG